MPACPATKEDQLDQPPLYCHPVPPVAKDLEAIGKQYPFELPAFKRLRLTFPEGIKLLQENGYPDVSRLGGQLVGLVAGWLVWWLGGWFGGFGGGRGWCEGARWRASDGMSSKGSVGPE